MTFVPFLFDASRCPKMAKCRLAQTFAPWIKTLLPELPARYNDEHVAGKENWLSGSGPHVE
jgi:hypothetical protein